MVTRTGAHDSLTGEVLDLPGWDGNDGRSGREIRRNRVGRCGDDGIYLRPSERAVPVHSGSGNPRIRPGGRS